MQPKHALLTLLTSTLLLLPGCIKEESVEIRLKAEDAIPPPTALGPSYSCEETFTISIEDTIARAKKWTSLHKDIEIAVYECKDKRHAEEVLQEILEEKLGYYEMREMIYKGKGILYNESEGEYRIIFTHQNLFIVVYGNSYGKDAKNDTFLLLDWVLYKLGIISKEPEIPEGKEEIFLGNGLKIILDIPRTVYHVEEKFEEGYVRVINYNWSRDVTYFIWYEMNGKPLRTGSGRIMCGGGCMADKLGDMTSPGKCVVMAPTCELTHNPYTGGYDKFWKPGNFTIVIACYDCKDIERITGKKCEDVLDLEDVLGVPPIKVVKKEIIVLEK